MDGGSDIRKACTKQENTPNYINVRAVQDHTPLRPCGHWDRRTFTHYVK